MKYTMISAVALAASALTGMAQADTKVAAVNVREVFLSYHKRFDVEEKSQKLLASIRQEVEGRQKKITALQEEIKALAAQGDSSLSESRMRQLREEYDRKMNELRALENELRDFVQRREVGLNKVRQDMLRVVFTDINKVIQDIAAKGDYDLVINSSSASTQVGGLSIATETFPYVKDSLNVTPEVIKALNADAPAGFNPEEAQRKLVEQVGAMTSGAEGEEAKK